MPLHLHAIDLDAFHVPVKKLNQNPERVRYPVGYKDEPQPLGLKDVVLSRYEDIRKGPDNWRHRTAFAEWMLERTGMVIKELHAPTAPKIVTPKPAKTPSLILPQAQPVEETIKQLRLF